jgi:hypothetical protein
MGTFAETAIVDYHLSLMTKENKLLFSVSVSSKQTEVCSFRFPFAANKQKLLFSVSPLFHLRHSRNIETRTWRHGDMELETDMRYGNIHRDMETWKHEHKDIETRA